LGYDFKIPDIFSVSTIGIIGKEMLLIRLSTTQKRFIYSARVSQESESGKP